MDHCVVTFDALNGVPTTFEETQRDFILQELAVTAVGQPALFSRQAFSQF
jgi:hypothetical protein